jgi:Dolichyl-phosphate-mannose-protein mannosyltransferase
LLNNGKHLVLFCGVIFLLALTVRFLTWQDNRRDIWKVQTSVTDGYKDSARQLIGGNFKTFAGDINHFGHPPGYPILLAAIFKIAGESDTAIHAVQIFCDVLAVVLLFLITLELFPTAVALIAALLAAVSPQFAYFSVLLLPDSLVVLPILLAVYILLRARKNPRLVNFIIAGALIGISCWLRANALLLPLFLAATASLLVPRGKRVRAAGGVVAGALLLIAPITIKNAVVYHRFVPLSLGAGQTLVEGIADYDKENRFNIPNTDLGLMRQEAEWSGNPEYAQLLFGRDGIERDRMRLARGFAVIHSHPFWFAGVVIRRGLDATRLEPVPVLARESPVSHDVTHMPGVPVWANDGWGRIKGDERKYGTQRASEVITVREGNDYVFQVPLKLEEGRIQVKVTNESEDKVLAAAGVVVVEGISAQQQPVRDLKIPFVSGNESSVRLVIANYASQHPTVLVGPASLVALGPSSQQWLRYLRIPLGYVQRVFTTAWMVPLVVPGLVLLIRKREWKTLAIILTVPAYYLIVQPVLHTERRYVYIVHFFLLIPAALTLRTLFSATKMHKMHNKH